jgi:hypothetical protein
MVDYKLESTKKSVEMRAIIAEEISEKAQEALAKTKNKLQAI